MKKIRICFHNQFPLLVRNLLLDFLNDNFIVEITEKCDFYFISEVLYTNQDNIETFLNLNKNIIRIFFSGEAVYPDLNLFDYAIILQRNELINLERVLYLPFFELLNGTIYDNFSEIDNIKKDGKEILNSKNKFCNFMYSNPIAHPVRDQLFYTLSEYKKVDSLGRHLKNVEIIDTRNESDWKNISVSLKKSYKFSIAAENARFLGYTSEKIVTSMLANTIPIYFGDPLINEQFNSKSFINASDFSSLEDLRNFVEKVDKDDALFCSIIEQPWRTPAQIRQYDDDVLLFKEKLLKIFDKPIYEVKKRPEGTWADFIYPKFLIGEKKINSKSSNYFSKLKSFIKKLIKG